jgi:3-oxoacyl-[acyl-carrier-protein] synthase III
MHTRIDLAIIGRGAVTPAGLGLDAMRAGKVAATPVEPSGHPGESWPVLRIDQKDPAFTRWQREPRLRRASPISFFLVEAAAQALGDATPEQRAQTGLIVAFSAGCLAYSRRFYEQIVRQSPRAASPALFPETVFNSPVSHVATVLGLNGAAYALVGDEAAWVSALITASVWLREGRVQQVLVLGAEEFDPLVLDAYRSARWLRRGQSARGFLTSEGAAGILVRPAAAPSVIPSEARDQFRPTPVITTAADGFTYRTKKEAREAGEELFNAIPTGTPLFRTAQHNWLASLEESLTRNHPLAPEPLYLGEAFLASAAWRTLQAAHELSPHCPNLALPLWGLNHQFGLLELATEVSRPAAKPANNRFNS